MNAPSQAAPPARQESLFPGEFSFTGRDFETIAGIIQQRAGINLPATKGALVYSRLVKRLRLLGLESFSDYCALLTEPGGEEESEVVLRALHHQAAAVVLSHNHPSGSVQPSRADEMLTQTLKTTLALIDVRVLDHVIVAPGEALSMAERGLL